MAEWSIVLDSKSSDGATHPRVRIPPSPPSTTTWAYKKAQVVFLFEETNPLTLVYSISQLSRHVINGAYCACPPNQLELIRGRGAAQAVNLLGLYIQLPCTHSLLVDSLEAVRLAGDGVSCGINSFKFFHFHLERCHLAIFSPNPEIVRVFVEGFNG